MARDKKDTFSFAGNAVSDIFSGLGSLEAAKGSKAAGRYAEINAKIAEQSNKIKLLQASRQIYRTLGGIASDVAGAGLKMAGSAVDLLRDSASQGNLSKQLIAQQGAIEVHGYKAEAEAYKAQAKAQKKSGIGSFISAAANIAGAFIFSDDRLKQDVVLQYRRPDGIGIYHFKFKGDDRTFEGVLAREVEKVYPRFVTQEDGYSKVDYGRLGVHPRVVGEATPAAQEAPGWQQRRLDVIEQREDDRG